MKSRSRSLFQPALSLIKDAAEKDEAWAGDEEEYAEGCRHWVEGAYAGALVREHHSEETDQAG